MLLSFFISLGLLRFTLAVNTQASSNILAARNACNLLKKTSPSLRIAEPGSEQYTLDIEHYSPSAAQNATCSVEPTSLEEVASLVKIIAKTRTPWAVKGHGHTFNQDFSSTVGLQISMGQFSNVTYDPKTKLARIGTGTSWDKAFQTLEAQGVMVVGGRIQGVGTGGLMLGGGYSYKTNQFGLASDNTVEYDLVTYAGDILQVNAKSYPDLFFALQGGLNNFGIVTTYTTKTHVQTKVISGFLTVPSQNLTAYGDAIYKFSKTNKDPKADILPAVEYANGQLIGFAFILYDGPTLPNGTFSDFIALGANLTQTTFSEFILGFPQPDTSPTRVASHTAPIRSYTPELINFVMNETETWGKLLTTKHSGTLLSNAIEVFLPTSFSASRDAAYPHSNKLFWNPLDTGISWLNPAEDAFFSKTVETMAQRIQDKAIQLGLSSSDALLYPNYAGPNTPLSRMYGNNVARLARISKSYDPSNLMSLTGGFKFNH